MLFLVAMYVLLWSSLNISGIKIKRPEKMLHSHWCYNCMAFLHSVPLCIADLVFIKLFSATVWNSFYLVYYLVILVFPNFSVLYISVSHSCILSLYPDSVCSSFSLLYVSMWHTCISSYYTGLVFSDCSVLYLVTV